LINSGISLFHIKNDKYQKKKKKSNNKKKKNLEDKNFKN